MKVSLWIEIKKSVFNIFLLNINQVSTKNQLKMASAAKWGSLCFHNAVLSEVRVVLHITTHELHEHNLEMIMRGLQKCRWGHSFLLLLFEATEFSSTKCGRKMIYLTLKASFNLYLCDFSNKNVISAFFASKNWFE